MSGILIVNIYIAYTFFLKYIPSSRGYDYRINIFGNNGAYPSELIEYATNLEGQDEHIVIEETLLNFQSDDYYVRSVVLDSDSFYNWYDKPTSDENHKLVIACAYSKGLTDNPSVYLNGERIEISGYTDREIPLGAMSNIISPEVISPNIMIVMNQRTANELYNDFPPTQQRQISIYYKTDDGPLLEAQMKEYSERKIEDIQIWDDQDFTVGSIWSRNNRIKRAVINGIITLYFFTVEGMIIFTGSNLKRRKNEDKEYYKITDE